MSEPSTVYYSTTQDECWISAAPPTGDPLVGSGWQGAPGRRLAGGVGRVGALLGGAVGARRVGRRSRLPARGRAGRALRGQATAGRVGPPVQRRLLLHRWQRRVTERARRQQLSRPRRRWRGHVR